MRSKDRVWYCPCCRLSLRRTLTDPRPYICSPCGDEMVQGFGYKSARQCRHRRARAAIARWEERMGTRVRTQAQHVYRPSATTKRLWREIRAAKTRPAIERRAQGWLDALLADTRDADFEAGKLTKRPYLNDRTGQLTWQRHATTYHTTPTIERVPLGYGLLGDFRRSILHSRYGIRLHTGLAPDELRRTLVHEALHVLDSEAHLDDKGHGRLWRQRLAEMEGHFPPTAKGRLP